MKYFWGGLFFSVTVAFFSCQSIGGQDDASEHDASVSDDGLFEPWNDSGNVDGSDSSLDDLPTDDSAWPVLAFYPVKFVEEQRTVDCSGLAFVSFVVRLYQGGTLLDERSVSCQTNVVNWGPVEPGDYEVAARAEDNVGVVFLMGWTCQPCGTTIACDAPHLVVDDRPCRRSCFSMQGTVEVDVPLGIICDQSESQVTDACGF